MGRYAALTAVVIGAGMEVHRVLAPGFLESVYEEALVYELGVRGIAFGRQVGVPVMHKGRAIRQFMAGFLIEGKVILEIKAVQSLSELDRAQVINYLKATGLNAGLLMNFGARSLAVRRVVYELARES